jgi:hypothetical protein
MNWDETKNSRRIDLIHKEVAGTLTEQERTELSELQEQALAFRLFVQPLPMPSPEVMECLSQTHQKDLP